MKKKIFISLIIALSVIFSGTMVFANDNELADEYADMSEEPVQISESSYDGSDSYKRYYSDFAPTTYYQFDYYKDDTVYYSDESRRFTKDQKQQITDLLKDTSSIYGRL